MPVLARYEGQGPPLIAARPIKLAAERMLSALRMPHAHLSILLCDDAVIHALNREHRHKDRPTDVLAFAMNEGAAVIGDASLLGDIVISLPTAARQARAAKREVMEEALMLLAHGLLHLLGDDHQTDAQERRMTARTDMLRGAGRAVGRKNARKPPR